jgi:hypothetical protein
MLWVELEEQQRQMRGFFTAFRMTAYNKQRQDFPQRLKPHCRQATCGTAEAVPLTKPNLIRESLDNFRADY